MLRLFFTFFVILIAGSKIAAQSDSSVNEIARLEEAFLKPSANERVNFPPLSYSKLWMPELTRGQGDPVCEDFLRVKQLEFLPRSSNYVPILGDLDGYSELILAFNSWSDEFAIEDKTQPNTFKSTLLYDHAEDGKPGWYKPRRNLLRLHIQTCPDFSSVENFGSFDLMGIYQLKAPGQFLEYLGSSPRQRSDKIIMVSEGKLEV